MTSIEIKRYVNKPSEVQAVQITVDNMEDVAKWCKGEVRHEQISKDSDETQPYIKAKIYRTLNERQTKGYPGDWVLRRSGQFKIYTDKAFTSSYMDDPNSIPLAEKIDENLEQGSVFQQMVDEREKPKETFLAVSGHETVFTTPPAGVPMRDANSMNIQSDPRRIGDGVPNFIHKSEEPMTDDERDAYMEGLKEKFQKEGFTGRVISTEPDTSAFFVEPALKPETNETQHLVEPEAVITPKRGLFSSFINPKTPSTEE